MNITVAAVGEKTLSKILEEVIREAKRIEESAKLSSKAHFAAAEFWENFHLWVGIPMVVLATVVTGLSFSSANIIAGIISIVVACLSGIITFLNPNDRYSIHSSAGNSYDALLNQTRIFWTIDCWGSKSEDILAEELKLLSERKDALNHKFPKIPNWAYRKAKKRIDEGESEYKVDKMPIDQVQP